MLNMFLIAYICWIGSGRSTVGDLNRNQTCIKSPIIAVILESLVPLTILLMNMIMQKLLEVGDAFFFLMTSDFLALAVEQDQFEIHPSIMREFNEF